MTYIETDYRKKKNIGRDLVLIGCCDVGVAFTLGGGAERELAGAEFHF